MQELNKRNYAHMGDAVWELFVREHMVEKCKNPKDLHVETTKRVKASFQAVMLEKIEIELTGAEPVAQITASKSLRSSMVAFL